MGEKVPNPGSREALAQGCICPVMDNWRGSDKLGRIRGFVMVVGCPLHSPDPLSGRLEETEEERS
jgi:hypothetical protein